jgi:hypothetical protein
VCEYESLIVTHIDPYGYGVGAGTCVVCSHTRSDTIVEDEAQQMAWQLRHEFE